MSDSEYIKKQWEELEDRFREKIKSFKMSEDPVIRLKQWIDWFSSDQSVQFMRINEVEEDFRTYKELALPMLIEASKTSNGGARYHATYYLMRLADFDSRDALLARLRDKDEWGAIMIDAAEGLFRIGDKEEAINYLVGRILDKDAHRDIRIRSAERLIQLGLKKVIPSDASLDLESIPPYLHEKLKKLFQALS